MATAAPDQEKTGLGNYFIANYPPFSFWKTTYLPDAERALNSPPKPGGRVVVYTVNKLTPVAAAAWAVPFRFHHAVKSLIWRTEEKDTFPVAYRMNTRGDLRRVFGRHGFREAAFAFLDDCRTFARFRVLNHAELLARSALRAVGLRYPENCLLGVYERV